MMDLNDHNHTESTQRIYRVLNQFVRMFESQPGPGHLLSVVQDGEPLDSCSLNQQPERFTEENLVEPILSELDHTVFFRPENYPKWTDSVPDFSIEDFDPRNSGKTGLRSGCSVVGEVKPVNSMEEAKDEAKDYLDEDAGKDAVAIATDGFRWCVWFQRQKSPKEELINLNLKEPISKLTLRHTEGSYHPNEIRDAVERQGIYRIRQENLEQSVRSRMS